MATLRKGRLSGRPVHVRFANPVSAITSAIVTSEPGCLGNRSAHRKWSGSAWSAAAMGTLVSSGTLGGRSPPPSVSSSSTARCSVAERPSANRPHGSIGMTRPECERRVFRDRPAARRGVSHAEGYPDEVSMVT